jgi:hypothetical protein
MPNYWSIGPIRGEFQPESFTETQEMNVEDKPQIGNVTFLSFKSWKPREISLSFVVHGDPYSGRGPGERSDSESGPFQVWFSPEKVWGIVCCLVRPTKEFSRYVKDANDEADFLAGKEISNSGANTGQAQNALPTPVKVALPGWGSGSSTPRLAIVTSASINRTHINAKGEAMRATISVTLKELAQGAQYEDRTKASNYSTEELRTMDFQYSGAAEDMEFPP